MKKILSLVLSLFLMHAFSLGSLATDSPWERSKKALLAQQVKRGVAELGTGKSSVVRVVLYDKTKYHGYITEIGEDPLSWRMLKQAKPLRLLILK